MNILTTLGRQALTTLTATAIVAGGVVAPHATAEEVKNADLYWGFSGSSHHKYESGLNLSSANSGAEIKDLGQTPEYKETFNQGDFHQRKEENLKVLTFHKGQKNPESNNNFTIEWKGEAVIKPGFSDPISIKDLKLEIKGENKGSLKANVNGNPDTTLFEIGSSDIKDNILTVVPQKGKCQDQKWTSWSNELIKKVGSQSYYFEGYSCSADHLARQPLPLTVVLNGKAAESVLKKKEEEEKASKVEKNTEKEATNNEEAKAPAVENKEVEKASEAQTQGQSAPTEAKETGLKGFLNSKAGQILTVALGVLGGLGALWTLWTKFSHLFVR